MAEPWTACAADLEIWVIGILLGLSCFNRPFLGAYPAIVIPFKKEKLRKHRGAWAFCFSGTLFGLLGTDGDYKKEKMGNTGDGYPFPTFPFGKSLSFPKKAFKKDRVRPLRQP